MNFVDATERFLNTTSNGENPFTGLIPSMSSDALIIHRFPSFILNAPTNMLTPL